MQSTRLDINTAEAHWVRDIMIDYIDRGWVVTWQECGVNTVFTFSKHKSSESVEVPEPQK